MSNTSKRGFRFRLTLGTANLIAAVLLIAGSVILVNGSFLPELSIPTSTEPVRDIALLLVGVLLLSLLLAIGTRADQRCAEDYAMQMLASAALVGMTTMMASSAFWAIDALPAALSVRGMRGQDQMAIGMIGWAIGYFTFRIRGLK